MIMYSIFLETTKPKGKEIDAHNEEILEVQDC